MATRQVIVADPRPGLNAYRMGGLVVTEMDGAGAVPEVDAVEEVERAWAGYFSSCFIDIFNRDGIGEP